MENDMNIYTVSEFHTLMSKSDDDVYTPRMVKIKLKQKYKECVEFATRDGKSDIILLDRTTKILSEDWYNTRKANLDNESVQLVQTAATLIKDAMRNHELESNVYPSINRATLIKDAIRNHELESDVYPSINHATLIKDAIRNHELESDVYPSINRATLIRML